MYNVILTDVSLSVSTDCCFYTKEPALLKICFSTLLISERSSFLLIKFVVACTNMKVINHAVVLISVLYIVR